MSIRPSHSGDRLAVDHQCGDFAVGLVVLVDPLADHAFLRDPQGAVAAFDAPPRDSSPRPPEQLRAEHESILLDLTQDAELVAAGLVP